MSPFFDEAGTVNSLNVVYVEYILDDGQWIVKSESRVDEAGASSMITTRPRHSAPVENIMEYSIIFCSGVKLQSDKYDVEMCEILEIYLFVCVFPNELTVFL